MAEEDKVTCPVCEHEVGTKEDGTRIKVHKIAGERCDGSDAEVQSDDVAPEGLDKGQSYEALESAQDDEQGADDSTDPADENGAQTDAQDSEDAGTFVHVIKVHSSCPYLDEQSWHAANARMASKVAQQAGHTLAGSEAKHTKTEPAGDSILVHYTVPVK